MKPGETMQTILFSVKRFKRYIIYFFNGIVITWLCFLAVHSIANSVGAIVISGTHHNSFGRDVSNMVTALSDNSVGYGVTNIYSGTNQTFSDFQTAITQMNNNGISELHVYISSHGNKNTIEFSGQLVSKVDFISAINNSSAATIHIVLDTCYSGTFYNDLSAVVGQNGTVITSTDSDHSAYSLWNSWFTSALTGAMQNSNADTNNDGKVDYSEALNWVKTNGGWLPNIGNPKSTVSIPTLSEWKQIFFTLLMLSMVMGFNTNRVSELSRLRLNSLFKVSFFNLIIFKKRLFLKIQKWTFIATALFIIANHILINSISTLDIAGILLCSPLLTYIIHLLILFMDEYESKAEEAF